MIITLSFYAFGSGIVMRKLSEVTKLTRIEHSAMLVLAVVAAEAISGMIPPLLPLLISLVPPVFISASAFAINDYFDVEADRENRRIERPLVSGTITKNEALFISAAGFIIGIGTSMLISVYAFYVALMFSILAVMYSAKLKDMFMVGNIYIAFTMVIPFLYGSYVVSSKLPQSIIAISATIFFAGLAREIHGMVRDYKGDSKRRRSENLVKAIGLENSAVVAGVLYSVAIVSTVIPFLYFPPFKMNLVYMIPLAIIDSVLAIIAFGYIETGSRNRRFYDFARNASLFAMAAAVLVYLVSAITYIHA